MNKTELIEYADYLLQTAMYKVDNIEDAENIRCCPAHLTQIYRQVMVRYYIHGESIKQIAKALDIPENP